MVTVIISFITATEMVFCTSDVTRTKGKQESIKAFSSY